MAKLQDRIAIVTGGGTGIGKGIALAFAAEGAKVVLASRNRDNLDAAAAEISGAGGSAMVVPTDVTVEAEVIDLFRQTTEAHGRLDILVNNSGISTGTPTDELSLEDWQRVVDVNLTAAFLCSREAFRVMKPQGRGRIVNVGSVSAKVPRPNSAPYTATKFGLEGLTRSLAVDGRAHGIAVSVVQPGNTESLIWQGREAAAEKEGIMAAADVASAVVTMVSLPDGVNLFESTILPVTMPLLGRG